MIHWKCLTREWLLPVLFKYCLQIILLYAIGLLDARWCCCPWEKMVHFRWFGMVFQSFDSVLHSRINSNWLFWKLQLSKSLNYSQNISETFSGLFLLFISALSPLLSMLLYSNNSPLLSIFIDSIFHSSKWCVHEVRNKSFKFA